MSEVRKPNNLLLVVDDEKDIVQAYIDFLVIEGKSERKSSRSKGNANENLEQNTETYEILKAYNGPEALKVVEGELKNGRRIAGGFFDVKMDGGMDGLQTIKEIWKRDPKVNCTIVTAYQDRSVQDINQLFGESFRDQWDYLNKPFTSGEILQKARQMCASWNRRSNLEDSLKMLQEMQAQLVLSERMSAIGQVARGVGHEFGNILQRILGKADLSLNETDPGKIKENLSLIIQAVDSASVVIRNLQSFSKNSDQKKAVSVAQVFTDTLMLINHDLKKGNIETKVEKGESALVEGNPIELQQVFLNLIINAMHAMPKGGVLSVSIKNDNSRVRITVSDSGVGISPENLPKIFEYAFTTKGEKGSGLGLSISQKIIEDHRGTIKVASELGKGTTFEITLPGLQR
ncbi:MAG TPA: ATP-binding protein [Oligoflexia bacterium]|nr:ATP-binding protein [Oligoflexia bacterium]